MNKVVLIPSIRNTVQLSRSSNCTVFLIFGISFLLCVGAIHSLEVSVSSPAAILINQETGAILYEKNGYSPMYPASTTKIATLLFILDQKNPATCFFTVSKDALRMKDPKFPLAALPFWNEVDGTKMGLLSGEVVSVESLLHGMMLLSGNDAANVLAEGISSTIPGFMEELNDYLHRLGCVHTHFYNPHGLHFDLHTTTAHNLALMMKKGMQIPKFCEILSAKTYKRASTNKQKSSEMMAINPLIKPGSKHYDPRVLGGKTGYHSKAGYNLVAVAKEGKRTLIAVLLGSPNKNDRYEDAKRLFNAAFQEKQTQETLFSPSHFFKYTIEDAQKPLVASLKDCLTLSYFPSEKEVYKAHVHWDIPPLPIKKGQKVGEVKISNSQGILIQIGEIFAKEDVALTWLGTVKGFWRSF